MQVHARPSGDNVLVMRLRRETLPAKNTPERMTPTNTPRDKSPDATTVATVASITTDDGQGLVRNRARDRQENVLIETMIITAVNAATGTRASRPCSTTSKTSRNAPATSVDKRPRAPDVTLMTDWPIMAHPPMPPDMAEAILAMP